jgi:formylglycine-generating enzyme required for sulfatase activity/dienelactone hydrolase
MVGRLDRLRRRLTMMREPTPRRLTAAGFLAVLCLAALLMPLRPTQAQKPIGPPAPTAREGSDQRGPTGPAGEFERLKEEVRQLKAQVDELRSQYHAMMDHLTFAPVMEARHEDYARARAGFQTKLVRKGPAPQGWSPLKPPDGVSEVEYTSGELRLKAWVNRPADEKRKHPAVLFLHGGFAFGKGDWEQTKPYRDAGFVVLAPMLRGENGQPGAFSFFYDEVDDVLAAAEYLSQQPYVDAKRLFVAGHSVGGTMTLLTALASNRFRAAASFDGFPYWGPFTEDPNLPFDKSDPREIQLRSPIAYTGSLKCPLRIYHQARDRGQLMEYLGLMTRRMVVLARNRGLDVDGVEIEGDHMSIVPPAVRQSIAFFQRVSAQDIAPWDGAISPLPKALELDLGDSVKMKLARIESGKFRMGSPPGEAGRGDDERPHEAVIAKPYAIGVFPVTQAQYRQVMGTRPSRFSPKGRARDRVVGLNTDDFPVENVTWDDARDFCRIVSLLPAVRDKGWVVDLPTEAEWEYACRAGTETALHFGNALSSRQANFNGNNPYGDAAQGPSLGRTTQVGSYPANAWGLFDMHGNVLQWCKDAYDPDYQLADQKGPSDRVVRGGLFNFAAKDCRSARRFHFDPTLRVSALAQNPTRGGPPIGFRVVVRQREK